MKRILIPVLGVFSLAASAAAHAQVPGWSTSTQPAYVDDRPAVLRVAACRLRQRISRGNQAGRKGRAEALRLQLPGRANLAARRQGVTTAASATSSDTVSRSAPATARATQTVIDATRPTTRTVDTAGRFLAIAIPSVYRTAVRIRQLVPGGYGSPDQNRYPGGYAYPGQYGYGNVAYSNGLNDGLKKGREDLQKRRSYDPAARLVPLGRSRLSRRIRVKDLYRDAYRQAFKEGYDRGYRGNLLPIGRVRIESVQAEETFHPAQ